MAVTYQEKLEAAAEIIQLVKKYEGKLDKFTTLIGNPPYQKSENGKNTDIWPVFIKVGSTICEQGSFIHPARWVIPKSNMVPVQKELIELNLKHFDYISEILFPGSEIDGNVATTFFDFTHPIDEITYSVNNEFKGTWDPEEKFFTNAFEQELYESMKPYFINGNMDQVRVGVLAALGGQDFGYRKVDQLKHLTKDASSLPNPVRIWANPRFGKGTRFEWFWINEDKLVHSPDYKRAITSRKIMLDKKGHALSYPSRSGNIINNSAEIVKAKCIGSEKVFLMPVNDTSEDLLAIKSLMTTRTARALMSITQKDLYVRGLDNIPLYTTLLETLKKTSDNYPVFTDEWFYEEFNFSQDLINYIEKYVSFKKYELNDDELQALAVIP